MRLRLRSFVPALLAATTVLSSASAFAATFFYGDLLTSDKDLLLSNRHASATLATDFKDFAVDSKWSLDAAGSGLGSGNIPPAKTFTQTFTAPAGAKIEKAWLLVSFSDDGFDLAPETATVDIGGAQLQTKGVLGQLLPSPLFETVSADVTAQLLASADGSLKVTVSTANGKQDAYVQASLLKVQYSLPGRGSSSAVPEPGAFLIFAVGLVVTAARIRGKDGAQPV